MNKDSKIFIAGGTGLVGSSIIRRLQTQGFTNLISTYHSDKPLKLTESDIPFYPLDITIQSDVNKFFDKERPEYVFLAAARVGGIVANNTYKADFIYQNIMIASNVIHASYKYSVKKLLNLGSSCIYPKFAPQPMKEDYLLTGELEPTNEAYAIAKIAAIKLCRYYNEQYGTNFISVMPTNLYGVGDNFDLKNSHVLPALIRKLHLARLLSEGNYNEIIKNFTIYGNNKIREYDNDIEINKDSEIEDIEKILKHYGIYKLKKKSSDAKQSCYKVYVELWGTGTPFREFLYVDDLADTVIYLMKKFNYNEIGEFINIGSGTDITIKELAYLIKGIVGFEGEIEFDSSKPDGTPRKLLDVSRINNLGCRGKIKLREGIEKTYNWYLGI